MPPQITIEEVLIHGHRVRYRVAMSDHAHPVVLLVSPPLVNPPGKIGGALGKIGLRGGPDREEVARGISTFCDIQARTAFVHMVRAAIDPLGQRVSARDRLYLADGMPTLIIWG